MPKFLLFAAADFTATYGPLSAGEPIAEIQTNLELGELSSLIRTRHLIHVESDEDQADGSAVEGTAEDAEQRELKTLLESRHAKVFATAGINTVAELAAWLAEGNEPHTLNGITKETQVTILAATGLTLP